jgi:predicted RNA binding protein YcfA (HicA-like mRNA interferase family)
MPGEVRFGVVRKLLERAGYSLVRVSGSHHIFERAGRPLVSIPVHHGKVKPYYVRQVKRIVEAENQGPQGS